MKQDTEIEVLRMELATARREIDRTKCALADVTNTLHATQKQCDSVRKKVSECGIKLEVTVADYVHFEEEKNKELSELVGTLQGEIATLSSSKVSLLGKVENNFYFQTRNGGKVYSPAIRELYYSLLTNEMPPSKIATTIKSVFYHL